ncbi:hypothetical protein SAMN02746095_02703 [Acidocella aminolytica 101 = DSM 11237]|nr:hypothetical protein SAMN02746095_02703 [Acidocella aminolytica 101 = DSM 11237]
MIRQVASLSVARSGSEVGANDGPMRECECEDIGSVHEAEADHDGQRDQFGAAAMTFLAKQKRDAEVVAPVIFAQYDLVH